MGQFAAEWTAAFNVSGKLELGGIVTHWHIASCAFLVGGNRLKHEESVQNRRAAGENIAGSRADLLIRKLSQWLLYQVNQAGLTLQGG